MSLHITNSIKNQTKQVIYWDLTLPNGIRIIYDLINRNKTGNKELTNIFEEEIKGLKTINGITNSIITN